MKVCVLGPVAAEQDGAALSLGGPKPTTLLALLAIHVGTVVTTDQIVDALWWDRPPGNVQAALHTLVSALRRLAGPQLVVRKARGYLLSSDHVTVDLDRARQLVANGQELAGDGAYDDAVIRLREALALWRADHTLGGATGDWTDGERSRIAEYRLGIQEDLLEAALATGREGIPVAELTALVEQNPLRERLRGQLIRTLVLRGRQADALSCYHEGARVLADELGVRPGAELQAIQQQVLAGTPVPTAPRPEAKPVVPRQLPAGIADFTGRTAELRRLAASVTPVVALAGQPGAGKSTLAVHYGRLARDRFVDGELYVDLRGANSTPLAPIDVLGQFLRALAVAENMIPATLDERAALFRSLLADRAALVLLDNAADETQVRPLLPSGSGCLCLITSRNRLSALAGVDHVDVGTLDEQDALHLLARLAGDERLAREPEQAKEIVQFCGRLPLAVRVIGARLAARPDWRLARMVERLREQRRLLDELSVGDLEVRGSLNLSYQALPQRERLALRRLGWLGASDFSPWLLAALTGIGAPEAEDVAEYLVDAQLVDTVTVNGANAVRYGLHDLTRVFAWERAEAEEPAADLVAAVARAADWGVGLVDRASGGTPARLLSYVLPSSVSVDAAACPGGLAESDPLAWFDAEQATLVHLVERASELELAGVAARLAATLGASTFTVRNHFAHWWRTHIAALAAARRADDVTSQGLLLTGLGWLRSEQDRLSEAIEYYEQALTAFEQVDNPRGTLATQLMLSGVQRESGRLTAALRTIERAWPAAMAATEPEVVARACHVQGTVLTELGRLSDALRLCERAAAVYEAIGDPHGVALVLRSTGIAHRAAGRLDLAALHCERALAMLRSTGDHLMTAYAVQALAKVRVRQGSGRDVREALTQAHRTCHEMQDRFGQALMLRTLGELDLAIGRPERAVEQLEGAMALWSELSLPLWQARCKRDLARALCALSRHGEAERLHGEAMAVFQDCGSREAEEERAFQAAL